MELPGWEYFYSLAALSLAFAGFTSIVVVLRQGTGKPLSQFHLLLTRLFIELGLMATAFAILAPTLAICGIRQIMVWQISSAIMLVILVPWLIAYPFRRKAAALKERMPLRVYIMLSSYTLYLFPLR
jgi:purine-cytosine permease-like protein